MADRKRSPLKGTAQHDVTRRKRTLLLICESGNRRVPTTKVFGLFVHRGIAMPRGYAEYWNVSHHSGIAVAMGFVTKRAAIQAARELRDKLDWSLPARVIMERYPSAPPSVQAVRESSTFKVYGPVARSR